MCFRPAQVEMNICPNCGKANTPIAKVCDQCGAELEMKKQSFDADADAIASKATSVVPNAPSVPLTPGVPKPPSAPVAPNIPEM